MHEDSPLLLPGDQESMATHSLELLVHGQAQTLTLGESHLFVPAQHASGPLGTILMSCGPRQKSHTRKVDVERVIVADYDCSSSNVNIAILHSQSGLQVLRGTSSQPDAAADFVRLLLQRAYKLTGGVPPKRRLKVLLNPAGGQGKAMQVWAQAEKILKLAGCHIDFHATTHSGHAKEIGASIDPAQCDAVVLVSGDGLPWEYLNGVKSRSDAVDVLSRLPIAQIGAGTSNALTCNLVGPQYADDVNEACLAIIKGQPTPIPLCKVQQDAGVFYSFLSQAMGLIADCDVGSDAYRWAGRNRIYVAYVGCVIAGRSYPCTVELKVVESGAANAKQSFATRDNEQSYQLLRQGRTQEGTWQSLPLKRLTCFYAGTIPWTDPGMLAFPMARGDGLIDVIISETNSRKELLTLMDGTELGKFVDHPSVSHYRVSSYRLTPKKDERSKSTDLLVIDGERLDYAPIEVSVDGCFFGLSLHGHDRFLPASHWS